MTEISRLLCSATDTGTEAV